MKKYWLIILLTISLVIFNIAIVAGTYLVTQKITQFNAYNHALAQQQISVDKLSKDIIDIDLFIERLHNTNDFNMNKFLEGTYIQIKDIHLYYTFLNQQIKLFGRGGVLQEDGKSFNLPKPMGELATIERHTQELWQPLSALLENVIQQFNTKSFTNLHSGVRFTADYIRKYSEILGQYLGTLRNHYQSIATEYSYWLRIVHLIAIIFNLFFFTILTLKGLRSLVRSDQIIERTQRETENIMKTVKEGLFLIDNELTIGNQYSAQLEDILGQRKIAKRKLGELLSSIISKQDYEVTEEFIGQLFNEDVIESLIEELNPLDRIKVYITQLNQSVEMRYLSFNFSRVYDDDGKIINILVSVADITHQVMLEERIEKERTQHDEQIELLSSILNIPTRSLDGFMRNATTSCEAINNILRKSSTRKTDLLKKAERIFREAHGMKGEASALGLQRFISIAEEMEDHITNLKKKPDLNGRDFLPFTIELDRAIAFINKIKELREKLGDRLKNIDLGGIHSTPETVEEADIRQFTQLVQEVAKRNGKQVKLSIKGWNAVEDLSQHQQDKLRELVIQLLRNAVVHGIEDSATRSRYNKSAEGLISCQVSDEDGQLKIVVRDDGQGIDFAALKQRALVDGYITGLESAQVLRQKLIKYLFMSGVSTAQGHNEDAGRGVGMDVVKSRVQELGAKISLGTQQGVSTTFIINIPITV